MRVPLFERESDQITHAPGIIIIGLFNVMLVETEVETLFVLWVGSMRTQNYGIRVPGPTE